jgi:hypothetical protein
LAAVIQKLFSHLLRIYSIYWKQDASDAPYGCNR